MDKYEKVEKPREETTIKENEIRITTKGKMRNSISYATTLFREKGFSEVVLKAMGRAINKTVAIAEILKRRIPDLHQITEISSTDITDVYEPLEEGLDRIETTRHVSSITIVLSTVPLDTTAPGYQPPLPADQVKEPVAASEEGSPGQAPRNAARRSGPGRGRGGRGRGRGGRRGGFAGAQGGAVQEGGQAEYDEAAPPANERRERPPKAQATQGAQAQAGHNSPTQGEEGRPPRRGRGGRPRRGRGGYNRGGDYAQADDFEAGENVAQGYNQPRSYNQGGNQGYNQGRNYSQGRNRNYNQGENYSQGDNYNQRGNFYAQEGQQGGDYSEQQGGEGAPAGRGLRGGFRGRGGRRGGPRGAPRGARRGGRGGSEGASSPQPTSDQ